jgi:hypothetical protein
MDLAGIGSTVHDGQGFLWCLCLEPSLPGVQFFLKVLGMLF